MNIGPEHLLIVDDDPTFTEIMRRSFEKRGFTVSIALDEKQALASAKAHLFHKVILDLKLEYTSGLQLIEELKKEHPNIDIIILTGYSSISTAVEAIKLGAINYLCKPATIDEILSAFNKLSGDPQTAIATKPLPVDRIEWEHIQKILLENDGNISATARALGMHRRTLQRKLQKRPVKINVDANNSSLKGFSKN